MEKRKRSQFTKTKRRKKKFFAIVAGKKKNVDTNKTKKNPK